MATARSPHADSRLPKVLDEAARLFRTKGFEGTSVRDIARAVGMLPGSLYCHFETKEALLVAVYVKGVQQITDAVRSAVDRRSDPWDRLEAACVAHLDAILDEDDYAQVVVRVRPADVPVVHASLIELRNQYVLGYSPKNTTRDGKYRRVQVKLVKTTGLPQLRAMFRTGYYAPTR